MRAGVGIPPNTSEARRGLSGFRVTTSPVAAGLPWGWRRRGERAADGGRRPPRRWRGGGGSGAVAASRSGTPLRGGSLSLVLRAGGEGGKEKRGESRSKGGCGAVGCSPLFLRRFEVSDDYESNGDGGLAEGSWRLQEGCV